MFDFYVSYKKVLLPYRTFLQQTYFVVYGFELLVRVWLVSEVFTLVVADCVGSVFSLILTVKSVRTYHLPVRHMMDVHLSFTSFPFSS